MHDLAILRLAMMQAKLVFIALLLRTFVDKCHSMRNLNMDNVAHCIPNVDQGSTAKRPLSLAGKGTPAQSAAKRSRTLAYTARFAGIQ